MRENNYGTGKLIDHMIFHLDRNKLDFEKNFDFHQSKSQFDYFWGHTIRWRIGSMAYAYDAGGIKFVNLQNYPSYKTDFKNLHHGFGKKLNSGILDHDFYRIKRSFAFLKKKVDEAWTNGQRIVLMVHIPNLLAYAYQNPDFKSAIDSGIVIAVFCGHIHSYHGVYHLRHFSNQFSDYNSKKKIDDYHFPDDFPIVMTGCVAHGTFTHATFGPQSLDLKFVNHRHLSEEPQTLRVTINSTTIAYKTTQATREHNQESRYSDCEDAGTGSYFVPLDMPGQGRSVTKTWGDCRNRCRQVDGCAYYSWWPDGGCHIQSEYYSGIRLKVV